LPRRGKDEHCHNEIQQGLSLRRSLGILDACKGSCHYYNKPVVSPSVRSKGILRDTSILALIRELSLEHPTNGTRMMAVLLSNKLGRAINRKQVQHAYRILEWNVPRMTKRDVPKSASNKIPVPNAINQSWQTNVTYILCGIDGWGYLFNVLDVFFSEWIA
jgi:hypothetical protein